MIKFYNRFIQKLAELSKKECRHENLYPDINLQMKMGRCGHYLIHGTWKCQDCGEWIMLKMEDEWDAREGSITKDGKYQFQIINNLNKMVRIR